MVIFHGYVSLPGRVFFWEWTLQVKRQVLQVKPGKKPGWLPNLVMTFTICHGFSMAHLSKYIDGLPFLMAGWIFHGKLLVITIFKNGKPR